MSGSVMDKKAKAKTFRYFAGKRPEYAGSSSEEEEEEELATAEPIGRGISVAGHQGEEDRLVADELGEESDEDVDEEAEERRRQLLLERARQRAQEAEEDESEEEEEEVRHRFVPDEAEEDSDEDLDEDAVERRRQLLRERAKQRAAEEELLQVEDEQVEDEMEEDDESSEYEEYSDSEDDIGPRLKPVFVRKSDRVTVAEEEEKRKKGELYKVEAKQLHDLRKRDSRKLVGELVEQELKEEAGEKDDTGANVLTDDDGDEEAEYELWKLRELKRIKRDRDERDLPEKERAELERIRNMTEEDRRSFFRANPKLVTNKALKGKYKFLQKYYHRGAFYMDEEKSVLKQDFAQPTLEDHFDKSTLPKIMQVKNFGRTGRTKYTHLVDQDTTSFDTPWARQQSLVDQRQGFEKPSAKRKKFS